MSVGTVESAKGAASASFAIVLPLNLSVANSCGPKLVSSSILSQAMEEVKG